MPNEIVVLDAAQLKRIEGVHRGFLYQHLYAVACLLMAQSSGAESMLVEADEDIELRLTGRSRYIQVKTRAELIRLSDISSTLERFDQIRKEHQSGRRVDEREFVIVANVPPDTKLAELNRSAEWPRDVTLLYPDVDLQGEDPGLPPAFRHITDALSWCTQRAEEIPFGKLNPATLVWKVAALCQCAAAGSPPRANHEFNISDLPEIFEQIVAQLHDFPDPPKPYRPQEHEPTIDPSERVQLIVGLSGSGKTSWSSQQALHTGETVAYYDANNSTDVALALARELGSPSKYRREVRRFRRITSELNGRRKVRGRLVRAPPA